MDERLMIDEFDAAVSRLLSGAPVASVLAGSSPMVRPYVEAFAHVLVAPTVARPAFRTELRSRLTEGHARRDAGARWALNLRRTAAAAAAAALLGSAVGGALNPALADNLQRSIGETFG